MSRNCIYMTNYDISYIMIYHDISWYILIYNDISWHFVIKIKKHDFFAKAHNNDIFVAKIYDYVLFDSFWRSAGLIDSPTSYAALIRITKYDICCLSLSKFCIIYVMFSSLAQIARQIRAGSFPSAAPFLKPLARRLFFSLANDLHYLTMKAGTNMSGCISKICWWDEFTTL